MKSESVNRCIIVLQTNITPFAKTVSILTSDLEYATLHDKTNILLISNNIIVLSIFIYI